MSHSTILDIRRLFSSLTLIRSQRDVDALVTRLHTVSGPHVLSFLNAHAVNIAWKNRGFRQDLLDADTLVRDGKGVEMALKVLGSEAGENLNGTDFIPRLMRAWSGESVAFLGTREPYLGKAAQLAQEQHGIKVVCRLDGFRSNQEYVELVLQHRPKLVVLAMGMPKQEAVSTLLRSSIDFPCLIVNGGAVLDYISGRVPRAPRWMRDHGWEWLFRLCVEPVRLFKRYVVGNAIFLWRLRRISSAYNSATSSAR